MKLTDFIGKNLDKDNALLAESLISKVDLGGLDDSHMFDDPDDDLRADFSDDADDLGFDVQCFIKIATSPKGIQFRVSPKEDMVVPIPEFKKLVASNRENIIDALNEIDNHLDWYVRAFTAMKKKGHKTSVYESESRQKLPYELNGLQNSDAALPSKVFEMITDLRKVLKENKASNVKSTLTADDIKPFLKANHQIINKLNK